MATPGRRHRENTRHACKRGRGNQDCSQPERKPMRNQMANGSTPAERAQEYRRPRPTGLAPRALAKTRRGRKWFPKLTSWKSPNYPAACRNV